MGLKTWCKPLRQWLFILCQSRSGQTLPRKRA
ncbi:hypothetical protein PHLH7_28090 [Pseudomonas sp. Ost2]|nr:hypothetical protein PHLH7_28090 [Pseudomonas sp. Ost2]